VKGAAGRRRGAKDLRHIETLFLRQSPHEPESVLIREIEKRGAGGAGGGGRKESHAPENK